MYIQVKMFPEFVLNIFIIIASIYLLEPTWLKKRGKPSRINSTTEAKIYHKYKTFIVYVIN